MSLAVVAMATVVDGCAMASVWVAITIPGIIQCATCMVSYCSIHIKRVVLLGQFSVIKLMISSGRGRRK